LQGRVILITGAAGTGKSTLVRSILAGAEPFKRVDYGQLLLDHKARQTGVRMTYEELRRDSATAITPEDVRTVDEWLIGQLPQWRTTANLLIDSHPVTKEDFGFRVTPFSLEQIRQIQFDVILVLVGEPEQLAQRVALEPLGRPAVNAFQSGFQVYLQSAIAALYAVTCGRPCFALDTTRLDAEQVAAVALKLLEESGVPMTRSSKTG
jgi:adenylate kinase